MKILNLEFKISNYTGTKDCPMGAWKERHSEFVSELSSQTDVEAKVNSAIFELDADGKEVVDVRTSFVTLDRHNNGGIDTVMEYVTILYR